ncbi:MAG: outer membrane protein transport protein [Candidatus Cloacimonetes bacterium]|nr:outer membrane protein transport protein [Candidatus Cloacimonadota bacterium]
MKKSAIISLTVFFLLFCNVAFSQSQNTVMPWMGMEESVYHDIPVGGWNLIGAFSLRSTAMGETLLSNLNPISGCLNPAFLTSLSCPQFSLSYRFSENTYKTTSNNPFGGWIDRHSETRSFIRKTDYLDGVGIALPFKKWTVAANYFLLQEFNFPNISGDTIFYPSKVKQSGELKGVNFAVSHRLTSSFSMGISASYIFGKISRFQVSAPIYYIMDGKHPNSNFNFIPELIQLPYSVYIIQENYDVDIKGLFFNAGLNFKVNEKWLFGLALRPPFKFSLKAEMKYSFPDSGMPEKTVSGDFYIKQPIVVIASVLYKPLSSFILTADLSYWGWRYISSDYRPNWYYPHQFKNIVRMNLGAEYHMTLPFKLIEGVSFRAGYIYDPQPYEYYESFARNFFCAGLCLNIGKIDFETAAKISLNPDEKQRFHSNVYKLGLGYRF